MDEEDRRPTQRRRIDRAQAGTVDDDEDAVRLLALGDCDTSVSLLNLTF